MTADHEPSDLAVVDTAAIGAATPRAPESRRTQRLGWILAIALALFVAVARMHVALADPEFDAHDPSGMLKSDPALLYALTERMVDAGGTIPADFAHDTTLEHPDTIDVAARFPLGGLMLVAWAQRFCAGDTALHVTASWVASLAMGATILGVFLLARELSRSSRLALLAAAIVATTPAFHRTIGFVFVDEDWFWPLFALHLGLTARAVRVRSASATIAAAIAAAAALATWHAAGFFLTLEAVVAIGWLTWTGRSPLAVRGGSVVPIVLAFAALAVPFLREVGAVFSVPVAAAVGLALAARAPTPRSARAIGFVAVFVVLALGRAFADADGAYGHVFALLAAKIDHLGVRPPTSSGLADDVRILWQGPFATPSLAHAANVLALGCALGIAAAVWAFSPRLRAERGPIVAVAALFVLSLAAAWFAERALVLPALLAPPLAAWAAARLRFGAWILGVSALGQLALGYGWASSYVNPWYHAPVQRQAEIRWMVETVERVVPRGEAVAADFMSSTAILAYSGNPIVFSPKWEAAEPRRRAIEFLDAFHHSTPAEFRALIVDRYRARWLVVDRHTLQYLARWSADLPAGSFDPLPGTAAAMLLSQDDAALRSIPGYELVARGATSDSYRIYRVSP